MRIGHIELFVRDPIKSKAFYSNVLGFTVVDVQGEEFVWLQNGTTEILLRPGVPPSPVAEYAEAPAGIVLYTDNLPETKRQLEAKGLEFRGTDGSAKCQTFTDPDGHWFQLVNPQDH